MIFNHDQNILDEDTSVAPQLRGRNVVMRLQGLADSKRFSADAQVEGWLAPTIRQMTENLQQKLGVQVVLITHLDIVQAR